MRIGPIKKLWVVCSVVCGHMDIRYAMKTRAGIADGGEHTEYKGAPVVVKIYMHRCPHKRSSPVHTAVFQFIKQGKYRIHLEEDAEICSIHWHQQDGPIGMVRVCRTKGRDIHID